VGGRKIAREIEGLSGIGALDAGHRNKRIEVFRCNRILALCDAARRHEPTENQQ
jgi:hypothetical protein